MPVSLLGSGKTASRNTRAIYPANLPRHTRSIANEADADSTPHADSAPRAADSAPRPRHQVYAVSANHIHTGITAAIENAHLFDR